MLKQRITEAVKSILNSDFGFDIYIVMKSGDSLLKRFILEEGNPNEQGGFKSRICESIKDTIQNKFLSEESLYAGEDDLANEQNRFYVIRQNEQYRPFEFLDIPENQLQNFRFTDKDNADAILFKFTFQRNGEIKQLWAYQKMKLLCAHLLNVRYRKSQLCSWSRMKANFSNMYRDVTRNMQRK